jgi:hypothetical protein
MFKHVFQVSELVLPVLELNELSSGREVYPRSKVVCEPELGEHDDEVLDVTRDWEMRKMGRFRPPFIILAHEPSAIS